MTEEEKLAALKSMVGDTDPQGGEKPLTDGMLSAYLTVAGRKVLRRLYPYRLGVAEVPKEYEYKQLEIAAYLVNKRGAEGETAHSENGISRTYENADVPDAMLREIVPHCAVFESEAEP